MDNFQQNTSNNNNVMGILCYLGILVLVPMLTVKNDDFIKYHTKQGFALMILGIIGAVLGSTFILSILGMVIGIFCLVLAIMGIMNVLAGKTEPLPIIGGFATGLKI